jgi:sulfotransferase family protein
VISYSHHLGATIDQTIGFMANARAISPASETHVHEMLGSWSEHVESWTAKPSAGLHVMRYEDMLDAPSKTFGALARFLGLNPPRERLERAIKLSSFKVLREQERRKGFKEKSPAAERFFREGRAGQWKKELTQEQIARVVEVHRTQMERFGYLPKGL